ncbi:hypothetical protein NEUTE2DRAFT_153216 [Neurospora tetrasperma FGSC 2509]|nr:hypothetical protein NEUTE2DRAFT_153216 [Neurospora tetrasperma FGSC 2509]
MQTSSPSIHSEQYSCYCSNSYQHRVSLLRHTRSCPACWDADGDLLHRGFSFSELLSEDGSNIKEQVFSYLHIPTEEVLVSLLEKLVTQTKTQNRTTAIKATPKSTPIVANQLRWSNHNFELNQTSRDVIHRDLIDTSCLRTYELKALLFIAHTYPTDKSKEDFLGRGQSYYYLVQHFIEAHASKKYLFDQCSKTNIHYIIGVCLAASNFGNIVTKLELVHLAEELASKYEASEFWTINIQLRKIELDIIRGNIPQLPPPPKNKIQFAEFVILSSQALIERGKLDEAEKQLEALLPPVYATQPSQTDFKIDYLKGKLHRFQGKFEATLALLQPIALQKNGWTTLTFRSCIQLLSVYSELGYYKDAESLLHRIPVSTDVQARILRVVYAELWLAQTLDSFLKDPEDFEKKRLAYDEAAEATFAPLFKEYRCLEGDTSKLKRRAFFRIRVGYAIIGHITGRQSANGRIAAISRWNAAYAASRECLVDTEGFAEVSCFLAIADLKSLAEEYNDRRYPNTDEGYTAYLERARNILIANSQAGISDSYYFCSLGTKWKKILDGWWCKGRGREVFHTG